MLEAYMNAKTPDINGTVDGRIVFGIPGPQGPQGEIGPVGATPNIQIGTVETLPAGSPATASMGGTLENPILNLGIPQGAPGSGGSGIAVTGATVGQTVKIAAVDENGVPTAWEPVDLPSGGSVAPGYRLIGAIVLSDPVAKLEFSVPAGITDIVAHFFNKYDSELSAEFGFFTVNGKSVIVGQNMSLNGNLDQQLALHFTLLTDGKAYVLVSKGSQSNNNSHVSGLAPCGWLKAWDGDYGDAITKVAFCQVDSNKTFGAGCAMEVWGK